MEAGDGKSGIVVCEGDCAAAAGGVAFCVFVEVGVAEGLRVVEEEVGGC